MELSVTGEGSLVAYVPPVAPSRGEGWAVLVAPIVSCVVVIFVVLMSDCGGWVWFVSLLVVRVGVR